MKAGAVAAGKETGANIIFIGPNSETDVNAQFEMIEDQIIKGVSGLLICPTQPSAEVVVFNKAAAAHIPVAFIDSDAQWDQKVSFIGTGNYEGGVVAGEYFVKSLKKTDRIVVLRGQLGDPTHDQRLGGFADTLKKSGYSIAVVQPANSDTNMAMTVMQNLLQRYPDIKGVYCTNDGMVLGAQKALEQDHKTNVISCGFDGQPACLQSIAKGGITATVAQDPYAMGYKGVKTLVDAINGKGVDKRIDTGTALITKDNALALYDKIEDYLKTVK